MKKSKKKFLGMSQKQIAILAGFSLIILVMICGLIFFVLSNLFASPVPQPVSPGLVTSPIAPSAAATATSLPSLTPTIASEAVLTATPAFPATPPAGWIKFESSGAELWLPDSFVGGDMTIKRNESIQKVNNLGKRFADVVASMKVADENVILFMVDKNVTHTVIREVTMEYVPVPEEIALQDYIDAVYVSEGDLQIAIYENKKMIMLGRETRRLTYQSRLTYGLEGTVVEYAIKDGPGIWFVAYIFPPEQILDIMPMIEQSVATLNLIR